MSAICLAWTFLRIGAVAFGVSFLKSRPSRLSCVLRTDPLFGRSWSDGLGFSFGPYDPRFARTESWRWRTWRFGSNSPCGRRASRGPG